MGTHRRLSEFSEESRVQSYSEGSERSICTFDLPTQTMDHVAISAWV